MALVHEVYGEDAQIVQRKDLIQRQRPDPSPQTFPSDAPSIDKGVSQPPDPLGDDPVPTSPVGGDESDFESRSPIIGPYIPPET